MSEKAGFDPTLEMKPCYAIIYAPRRTRPRYPENCVTVVDSEAAALAGADVAKKYYPAVVKGPFSSSEGMRLFYLVSWLAE